MRQGGLQSGVVGENNLATTGDLTWIYNKAGKRINHYVNALKNSKRLLFIIWDILGIWSSSIFSNQLALDMSTEIKTH